MSAPDNELLAKVVQSLSQPSVDADGAETGSILGVAAASYGSRPDEEENTVPTGFDPRAAALFEAVVEAAYLVANADGEFDADERVAFEGVVVKASGENVDARQVQALLADLAELLEEDGQETRVKMIGRTVTNQVHQREVLRVAALLAHISGGVSDVEKGVLQSLAGAFDLDDVAVSDAISSAEKSLAS
ncbi:MAG: TerB family tellurite resistance protein [Polyangiaceae bacterium]|nr:TerB family tellurite resistance protein [Polyangiaceae bacterium]